MTSRGSCLRLCNSPPSLLLYGLHSGTWMIGSRILKQVGNQLRLQENLRYKYSPLQITLPAHKQLTGSDSANWVLEP